MTHGMQYTVYSIEYTNVPCTTCTRGKHAPTETNKDSHGEGASNKQAASLWRKNNDLTMPPMWLPKGPKGPTEPESN
eukprot:6536290-Alexandrium_andersonii.AAC.2